MARFPEDPAKGLPGNPHLLGGLGLAQPLVVHEAQGLKSFQAQLDLSQRLHILRAESATHGSSGNLSSQLSPWHSSSEIDVLVI